MLPIPEVIGLTGICDKASYGETGRGFSSRISEHQDDVRHGSTRNEAKPK